MTQIRLKRGTTVPLAGNLVTGELAVKTDTGAVYTKKDDGTVVQVGGGGAWGSITGTLSSQTDLDTALGLKAPLASPALTGNVTITTNSSSPALVVVQDGAGDIVQFKDVASDTTYSFIDAAGKVSTIASATGNAGLKITHGTAPTSPVDGDVWTTTSGMFVRVNGVTQIMTPTSVLSSYATLVSPTFTGDPKAPTPSTGDNDTSIATTAFVKSQNYLTSASLVGYYLPLSGGVMSGSITNVGATHDTEMAGDFFGVQLSSDHTKGTMLNFDGLDTYDGSSHMKVTPTGLLFPDSTVQTTATVAGPAGTNGTNGIDGANNYLDIITMTSSSASLYVSGGYWSAGYGFMNTSGGWFYNKLNASGVTFKFYINGVFDSSVVGAYNYYSASTSYVTTPISGDVMTVFISDGTAEATIPLIMATY